MTDATQPELLAPLKTWIYAIGVATSPKGPVKIGRTTQDVEQRLLAIQRGSDSALIVPAGLDRQALTVLFAIEAEPWVERRLHIHFHRYRVCGEWFALNPAVVGREVKMAISEIMREVGRGRAKVPPSPVRLARPPRPRHGRRAETKVEPKVEARAVTPAASSMSPKRHMQLYKGWIGAGFTEEQALRMVSMLATENR